MIVFAREALRLSESVALECFPLKGRGSERSFFRLKWNPDASAILVHYSSGRVENGYYADIALFLHDLDIPAPRVIRHDPTNCLIVMEDLGDRDLWSFREAPWEIRRTLYQKTLRIVHKLHSHTERDFPWNRVRLMEGFGPDLYRWERDYFRDHFLKDVCGIEPDAPFDRELEAELSSLAERLTGTRRSLVHRDLQSQNVMVRDEIPFLIDFQGMRFGSPFYDLGSLLCDPYVNFSDSEREELLSFCFGLSRWDLDWNTFRTMFWEASAQRLMQALGAYGFLGLTKGLPSFLEHIPAGLRNLHHATLEVSSLPRLRELTLSCQRGIPRFGRPGKDASNVSGQRREAVLFDLDGVIASSEATKSEAHVQTVLKLGGTPSQKLKELFAEIIGLSYEETRDRFLKCGKIAATTETKEAYRTLYSSIYRSKLHEVELSAGARNLIEMLAGRRYRIGLVSSAHPEEVATILRRNQIEHFFDVIITADSVRNHKPAPDPYLKALELLGLQQTPHFAVVFEDTCAGVTAAKAARLKVFAVRHPLNHTQDLDQAERIFDSLADDGILPIIEAYFSY
jgi:HAD superfamily hydrolase (TIGR01509 family)